MRDAGLALNATFKGKPVAGWTEGSGTRNTTVGVPIVVELPGGGGQPFDYVVTMEDLRFGQRIANYSFEYQACGSWSSCFCVFYRAHWLAGRWVRCVDRPRSACHSQQDGRR